jgi:hypothetical protein
VAEEFPYVVVIRARSAAHFPQGKGIAVQLPVGSCVVVSEYEGGENGWPVNLRGELRGLASSLDDAQLRFKEPLGRVLPLVALAANAGVGDPQMLVAHALTPNDGRDEWIGYEWRERSGGWPPAARLVEPELVGALLEAADAWPSGGYWGRAAGL